MATVLTKHHPWGSRKWSEEYHEISAVKVSGVCSRTKSLGSAEIRKYFGAMVASFYQITLSTLQKTFFSLV